MHYFCMFFFAILFPCFCFATQWPYPPITISTPGIDASAQQIAIDPQGNAVAVWLENGIVQSRFNAFNGSWTSPITSISGSGASSPQVVIDVSGNATAVWIENSYVKVATLPFNGSWSTPETLSEANASSPGIGVDSNGDLVIVWEIVDPIQGQVIQSATQIASGSWSQVPDTISNSGASFPQIAVGAEGTVAIVWQAIDPVTSASAVYTAMKSINGSWSEPQEISSSDVNSAYPQVAVSPAGAVTAAWFQFTQVGSQFSNVVVQSAFLPVGGSWGSPVTISGPSSRDPADLVCRVAVSGESYAVIAWTSSDGALFNEQFSVRKNGVWQGGPTLVGLNTLAYDIVVKTDDRGDAIVAWMYLDYAPALVINGFEYSLASPQNWSGKVWTLSNGGQNAYPTVSINEGSSAVYGAGAWVCNDGTNNTIQVLTIQFPIPQPVSNLSVTQQVNDFGVLTEAYNLVTWSASPSNNIIGYRIFRNGQFIATGSPSTLSYQDQNAKQGVTITYSIAAYNDKGFQSDLVDFVFSN